MLLCTYEMISFLLKRKSRVSYLASALIYIFLLFFFLLFPFKTHIDPGHWAICRQTVGRPKPSAIGQRAMQITHKLYNFLETRSSSIFVSFLHKCYTWTEVFMFFSRKMPPEFLTVADLRNVCIRGFWFQFFYCLGRRRGMLRNAAYL